MTMARCRNRIKSQRGTALIEAALTIPLLLILSVVSFEFGRAFETWQIMTNAAREGARVAVLPGSTEPMVISRVQDYLRVGLSDTEAANATIGLNDQTISLSADGSMTAAGSQVVVSLPFQFMVLNPVAQLVVNGSTLGQPITLTTSAVMRNEAP
jgi:Flp pilus assembly protein TadG